MDKFLISLGIQPADRCIYVCYDGAFKKPKQVSFADSETAERVPVTYYVCSQKSEVTQQSSDIAEEVHKSLLVEERLFSVFISNPKLGNRGGNLRRRRLKIVLGLLLLMKLC